MRVIVAGGGTGGHVTPIKYLAQALKARDGQVSHIMYVGPKNDPFVSLVEDEAAIDSTKSIYAGKWRRYPEPLIKRLLDIKTILLNVRDVIYLAIGFFQAAKLIFSYRPNVVMAKGGYPAIPIGLAAYLLRVPVVLHDYDSLPGLANRIVSRWAKAVAVGQDLENYNYPKKKMHKVGIPIHPDYNEPYNQADQLNAKRQLKLKPSKPLVFVLGGSLGALSINQAMAKIAMSLSEKQIQVIHVSGRQHHNRLVNQTAGLEGYKVVDFISDPTEVFKHYLAADIVISRAGATNIAEISALAKPSIIIPAMQLSDQQKNGAMLEAAGAAEVIEDRVIMRNPNTLESSILKLIDNGKLQSNLSKSIGKFASPDAAKKLASLVIKAAKP